MPSNVVFLHGLGRSILDWILSQTPADFSVTAASGKLSEAELAPLVDDAEFLMVYRARIPDPVLRSAKRVRFVQGLAAGYDEFNLALMRELDIPFAQNAGANSTAVAEHAVLLMLALARRLVAADRATREGRWREPISGLNTWEMDGKLVGIVGMGKIGMKVAARVQAFGARVQYYDQFPVAPDRLPPGVAAVSLDDVFHTSDIVTLHMPLTEGTRKLVSRQVLASMKSTAVIINTSRGEIIDELALIEALKQERIAGAGLDVYPIEPVDPANPLFQLRNIVVTPHCAGTTIDSWRRRLEFAFGNMRRVIAGETPLGIVTS